MTDVLVFVPGLLGSELYDGDTKIWPGSLLDGVFGFSDDEFQRLLEEDLDPRAIIESVGGIIDIYGSWLRHFESMRRRSDNSRLFRRVDKTLVVVPYDWRKSITIAADRLAAAIDDSVATHGAGARIHLAAHSLGGLVSRYYLQSGSFANRPGFSKVATLVTFGAPHNGAAIALAGVKGLHKTNFLSTSQSVQLANDRRFPSLYQTFPVPAYPLVWERGRGTGLRARGLGDRAFALNDLGLDGQGYDAYLAFRQAIDTRAMPAAVRQVVIMGTGHETLTHFHLDGRLQKRETPDGGDGTVAIQGAYLPNVQTQLAGEAHVTLIGARAAREAFQEIFDAVGMLAAGLGQIELSVRDLVVGANQPIGVLVISDGSVTSADGRFLLETASVARDGEPSAEPTFKPAPGRVPVPFTYRGPGLVNAAVNLPGISSQGVYRVAIELGQTGAQPVARFASPAFVVNALS